MDDLLNDIEIPFGRLTGLEVLHPQRGQAGMTSILNDVLRCEAVTVRPVDQRRFSGMAVRPQEGLPFRGEFDERVEHGPPRMCGRVR